MSSETFLTQSEKAEGGSSHTSSWFFRWKLCGSEYIFICCTKSLDVLIHILDTLKQGLEANIFYHRHKLFSYTCLKETFFSREQIRLILKRRTPTFIFALVQGHKRKMYSHQSSSEDSAATDHSRPTKERKAEIAEDEDISTPQVDCSSSMGMSFGMRGIGVTLILCSKHWKTPHPSMSTSAPSQ